MPKLIHCKVRIAFCADGRHRVREIHTRQRCTADALITVQTIVGGVYGRYPDFSLRGAKVEAVPCPSQ